MTIPSDHSLRGHIKSILSPRVPHLPLLFLGDDLIHRLLGPLHLQYTFHELLYLRRLSLLVEVPRTGLYEELPLEGGGRHEYQDRVHHIQEGAKYVVEGCRWVVELNDT